MSESVTNMISYPNPSNGHFNVSFKSELEQKCLISIYDISGRLMMERNIETVQGNNLIEMNVPTLSSGVYLMRLSGTEGINKQLRLNIE